MLDKSLSQQTLGYLARSLGSADLRARISPQVTQLPYFLQDAFEIWSIDLVGRTVMLACVKDLHPRPVRQIEQHAHQLRELLQAPVVVALPEISPGERHQLIKHGVAFVVPDRQLFAPLLGMILTERFATARHREHELASPATQALLVWFMNHHPLTESWHPFNEAALLGYAGMTATRAIRELLKFKLFELDVRGRAKHLTLNGTRRELWEKAKPRLKTPVLKTAWTYDRRVLDTSGARWAGETALAHLTALNEPHQPVIALSAESVKQATHNGIFFEPREIADGIAVQIWRYRPDIQENKTVDPCSLWLSLQQSPDDRIQLALDELERTFPW